MQVPSAVEHFLRSVKNLADGCVSVRAGKDFLPLIHPMWSFEEIERGLDLRDDWEVKKELIPFYGNWHDIICISTNDLQIKLLNDARNTICSWKSVDDFTNCLTNSQLNGKGDSGDSMPSGIIEGESWLDF